MEHPRSQCGASTWRWQFQCGIQETLQFLLGIQVRRGARRSVGQEFDGWNLGSCIDRAARASEAAYEAKPPRSLWRLNRVRLLYPLESKPRGDVLRMAFFQEADEPRQQKASVAHLVAQASAQCEIVL